MWRITRLYLKNVTYLHSGLHKNEVEIDFTKANQNSKLNLIIGPMGSGKSVILGHLQPFATFGTLDARNSESMILPEMDGVKIIEYDHDMHHYVIHHDYIWDKNMKSHRMKSYISKDGQELNTNGNSGSFKELVKAEFGIDQSFLRVIRLGPNVANVINMKATERKKFIASLQEDTEIYLMLYKKVSDDYRTIKASITSVSNRLMQLSATKTDDMRTELESLLEDQATILKLVDEYTTQIAQLQGINQALGGNDLKSLEKTRAKLESTISDFVQTESEIMADLESVNNTDETLTSISVKIGTMQTTANNLEKLILDGQKQLRDIDTEIDKLNDAIMVHDNSDHLIEMKRTLQDLEHEYRRYSVALDNFSCSYSYQFLAKFIDDLNALQSQIDELASTDVKVIQYLFKNQSVNITSEVTNKINMLTGRKVNLQKAMANIKFSAEYVEPFPIFRDPRCKFDQCPYFTTHPVTIRDEFGDTKDRDASVSRAMDEIDRIDTEIARYQVLPMLQKQFQLLINSWKSSITVLRELGIVSPDIKLYDILTDPMMRHDWYHYNQLIGILEKCKMLMEYENVASRYAAVKNEISILESPEFESNKKRLDIVSQERTKVLAELEQNSRDYDTAKAKISEYEYLYSKVQKREDFEKQLHSCQESLADMREDARKIDESLTQINANNSKINQLQTVKLTQETAYKEITIRIDRLKMLLSQIEYSQQEYQGLLEQAEVLRVIQDALSSKKGIPLILVRHFLNDCKDIVNDLISEIFDDDLEILDFEVTEDDFNIPYMVNGQAISDISYASQGQQSIISIALSFALVRQSMFDYNIMLLDEIDGPLHKNDREKFIGILFRQMAAIQADQVFLISHNSTFEGNPVNIFTTSPDEDITSVGRQIVTQI